MQHSVVTKIHTNNHTHSHTLTEQRKDLPTCAPLVWIREFINAKTEMFRQIFAYFILNIPLIMGSIAEKL
jgi:hypothetical protein